MDAVRVILRFQAQGAASAVDRPALSALIGKIIGRVKLHARQIGQDIHAQSGARILHGGNVPQRARLRAGNEAVVIPAGKAQLIPGRVDRLADGAAGAEIHGRAVHGQDPPGGQSPLPDFQKLRTVQCELLLQNSARVVPRQIEIAMVGEIDDGFPVAHALIENPQTVVVLQQISDADAQIAGEAALPVRAEPEKAHAVRQKLRLPELLVEAEREIAVQIGAVVVVRERIAHTVQREGGAGDPVGMAANGGAEKAAVRLVLREGVVAEHHIPAAAVRAGDEEAHENGAVVGDHGAHAAVVLHAVQEGVAARTGTPEGGLFNLHCFHLRKGRRACF